MQKQTSSEVSMKRRGMRPMIALAALVAAAVLGACAGDQPLDPRARAGDARPSLTANAMCADSLGGLSHTELTITAPVTWARADNPHRVNWNIDVTGPGRLTLEPGVLVCFGIDGGIEADDGGRVIAVGRDTAVIVLTARNFGDGWGSVSLNGSPDSASVFRNVRMEHNGVNSAAIHTHDAHAAHVDSVVVRQSARAFYLGAAGSRVRRSRVDTTTNAGFPAIAMASDSTHVEETTIRGAAGNGLWVGGTSGMTLTGVRILGSGGIGLVADVPPGSFTAAGPVRVTGGATYGAQLSVTGIARLYPQLSDQDSLLGNARDTLLMTGGELRSWAYARQVLPWRVQGDILVESSGILRGQPGSRFFFELATGITAVNGGRVLVRGTATARALMTWAVPGYGWDGIMLWHAPTEPSKFTNVQIEHAGAIAIHATDEHVVQIDSAVLRQNYIAAWLVSDLSSIRRSRVDTTTSTYAAVALGDYAVMESTRVRGSGGDGVLVGLPTAQILSCDVSGSAGHGVYLYNAGTVHDCNLAGNGGDGLYNLSPDPADAENNWWGDAAGPTGTNGDGVSGNVDYTPWRTTPFVLPYVP
jgi:hypothetical protein